MFKWLKARRERREQFLRDIRERSEFANYVPSVTAEDVLRIIRRDFPGVNPSELLAALGPYGAEEYHTEKHRVHAAILKLSNGDRDRLGQFVQNAVRDFREVLMPAEMPGFHQLLLAQQPREFAQRPIQEFKAIAQKDREQYIDWLNRETNSVKARGE